MERFTFETNTDLENIVYEKNNIRIALLTSRLLRIENGVWTDMPTQMVWNRALGEVPYTVVEKDGVLEIKTECVAYGVELKSGKLLFVVLEDGSQITDFKSGNLLGTARTLDMINGSTKLELGIMSTNGVCIVDDSASLLLGENGAIIPREETSDVYCFAYGHDYRKQLQDFFQLTGPVPLIPKYALGNWWSRYKAYSQEEYRELMQEFIRREVPITVATIDMDWHWTDVLERFGKEAKPSKPLCKDEIVYNQFLPGWTGYTWNTELFPDHKELLNWLHENNFKVPLNIHPSQGIRYFEDCYEAVCKAMGKDPATKELINFNITDPEFIKTYFDDVHHPLEDEGVDFWWIDWQQGAITKTPGLDPLWALNHYHTLDHARGNKRPLILSRYAGLGSHRYPLGFSGDTFCTWKSLEFQPYFTNTASNAGYTWWSHDIGGHQQGIQDDELYIRWVQYGVFSPINRLHSSNSEFMGKEPWKRSWTAEKIAEDFLRLRHKMIPYLYSANYETHTKGTPICMPMYYEYDCKEAYEVKNQFIFGGQLIVAPVTKPRDKKLNLAPVKVWLPEGRWTDIFNNRIYKGNAWVTMYRDLNEIPVLAKEGSIVPMYKECKSNDLSLEQPLEIHIWHGNGSYEMYEDDGETTAFKQGASVITSFRMQETEKGIVFEIIPGEDKAGLLPDKREMLLKFRDITEAKVLVDGKTVTFGKNGEVVLKVGRKPIQVVLKDIVEMKNKPTKESKTNLLTRVQAGNNWKQVYFSESEKRIPKYIQKALDEFQALL